MATIPPIDPVGDDPESGARTEDTVNNAVLGQGPPRLPAATVPQVVPPLVRLTEKGSARDDPTSIGAGLPFGNYQQSLSLLYTSEAYRIALSQQHPLGQTPGHPRYASH